MKKKLKKTLVSSLSVAVLSMSAASIVSANGTTSAASPVDQVIRAEANSAEQVNAPKFASISGVIQEIADYEAVENAKIITVKSADDSITRFVVTDATYVMDELKAGSEIVSFYDANAPVIFIYPPQFNAVAIAAVKEERTVKVDRFDDKLVSSDGDLKLNISEDTKITLQDGTAYTGELAGRDLVVTYSVSTDSIPAQTTPSHITVLNEKKDSEEQMEAEYAEVKGTIKSINEHGANKDMSLVELELADEQPAYLVISDKTYVDEKLEVGAEVVGYFNTKMPMILIYPPQYNVEAVAVVKEGRNTTVDRFDKNMTNSAGTLALKVSEDTKIVTPDGKPFTGSLIDRKLFVEYGVTTKSIPAQTNPSRIVVLEDESDVAVAEKSIVVGGKTIEAPAAFSNDEGTIMVPLRAIAEELGYEVGWNDETKQITLGHTISLTAGKDEYIFARMAPIKLGTAPVLFKGNSYVPLAFFTEVAQLSDAYVSTDKIVVNK
ncbi:stalk domain-containing protein [Paenibacillus sp. IITD108]|uniref:stalk domain-containing protein n=1 Tax=Paenibacillus sp. IITD108 TaxID=3116649 RepID=UPI002F42DFF7